MPQFPKFEERIKENLIRPSQMQQAHAGYGIIIDYDPVENNATVVMSSQGSDDPGEIFRRVPCPISIGLQTVAPAPGRTVWVAFKDKSFNFPVITHYFDLGYAVNDHMRQSLAMHSAPRFMLGG